ncbi:MAG: mobB [Lachnospiraceae bacterium]|jgi:molybdopterin-guanine dinucleotide biosynthesis protein|nr:mobB [Lachnospiraceae bacterium]
MELSIGILSGGKSRRMGRDKSKLLLHNKSFLDILVDEFAEFDDVLVSVSNSQTSKNYRTVMDEYEDYGPIEGIRQLLGHSKNPYMFICATDMPFLKKELVYFLEQFLSQDYDVFIIESQGQVQPLCGIYSKSILPVISHVMKANEHRVKGILKSVRLKKISLKDSIFSVNMISNINTEDEYIKCLSSAIALMEE